MRQHWLVHMLAIVVAVGGSMACCAGCERSHLVNTGVLRADAPQVSVPVNLPQPAVLDLHTSAAAAGVINGADFDTAACLPCNVSEQGDAAHFTPAWDPAGEPTPGGLAFALYWIEQPGYCGPQRITLEWSEAPDDGMLWLACANWQKNAWEWSSLGATETYVVDCDEGYMDIDGRLALVVLLIGTADATLTRLRYLGAPVADFYTDVVSGPAPLAVHFDGMASSSPNGEILHFEWDFNGDGVFDDDTGQTHETDYLFTDPRKYRCTLRITDELGAQAIASRQMTATGVYVTTVDAGGLENYNAGQSSSLAVVNGRPAISYLGGTAGNLLYVRALDEYGSAWGQPQTLDSAGNVGGYSSLCVTNGHPAISYADAAGGGVKYVQAKDADGAAWWGPITVDGSSGIGRWTSLAVVAGHPAIAFYNSTITALCFVRSTDADGTAWYATQGVDDSADVGQYCSLAVINGHPAIAYYDATNRRLCYVAANDAAGATWGAPVVVDAADRAGESIALYQLIDRPGIGYFDYDDGLYFITSVDPAVSGWGLREQVHAGFDFGFACSLCLINGYPALSYQAGGVGSLYLARAKWGLGLEWHPPVLIDDLNVSGGQSTSIREVAGLPGISYQGTGDLRFALVVD